MWYISDVNDSGLIMITNSSGLSLITSLYIFLGSVLVNTNNSLVVELRLVISFAPCVWANLYKGTVFCTSWITCFS